jgi:hypothetical protein
MLQKAVIRRDDATTHIVRPDPRSGSLVWIRGHEVRCVLRVRFLEELAEDSTLVEWLVLVL